jgi:hypothetical protein
MTTAIETADPSSEIRLLDDTELDAVNGGVVIAVAACAALFGFGMTIGALLANYKFTGNFAGEI